MYGLATFIYFVHHFYHVKYSTLSLIFICIMNSRRGFRAVDVPRHHCSYPVMGSNPSPNKLFVWLILFDGQGKVKEDKGINLMLHNMFSQALCSHPDPIVLR